MVHDQTPGSNSDSILNLLKEEMKHLSVVVEKIQKTRKNVFVLTDSSHQLWWWYINLWDTWGSVQRREYSRQLPAHDFILRKKEEKIA